MKNLKKNFLWKKCIPSSCVVILLVYAVGFCLSLFSCSHKQKPEKDGVQLSLWDRGVKVASKQDATKFAYFWFYEWHLFDAIKKGEHTSGRRDWSWTIDSVGQTASMKTEWLKLKIEASSYGAEMLLKIINNSDHDWPDIAALIPCFNPGSERGNTDALENPLFFDDSHENTWFLSENGLDLIRGEEFPREIHFNEAFLPSILAWEKEREDDTFIFSHKWPTSERNAKAGLMIRESMDKQWVMGIAWDDFISVQGHNPWKCMHLSVRIGPLARGESKTINGKMYLFKGSKEDCLEHYREDFVRMGKRQKAKDKR